MSDTTTRGIRIHVETTYLPEHSSPDENLFFFTYQIRITNSGTETVQLLSRRWRITDAHGRTEVVEGPGVVGQQPVLRAGESFEYQSFCPLATSLGTMQGAYVMQTAAGRQFEAAIAPFHLFAPQSVN